MDSARLLTDLAAICGSDYVQPAAALGDDLLCDWTNTVRGAARAAVFPQNIQEVAALLAFCNEHALGITIQGGNTGMSGGATPPANGETILLSLRRMNSIRSLDETGRTMVAEAGCILENVRQHAEAHGLYFPLSLGAKGSCQIGGNLATNAGGLNVLRYGNARSLCLGIEAVLADGRILSELSGLHKNNTGYDLKNLLIGSEGTLAVITAATLKLFPPPQIALTAWAVPSSPQAALQLMNFIQQRSGNALVAYEMMPGLMLELIARLVPELALPHNPPPPWSVLLEAADVPVQHMQEILTEAMEQGLAQDMIIAASETQRATFWRIREDAPLILARHGRWYRTDIALPLAALPAFIDEIRRRLFAVSEGVYIIGFGHIGDGNLHLNVRPGDRDPQDNPELTAQIKDTIYGCLAEYGGSFSAEHGIGQLKTAIMQRYKDPTAYAVMQGIKRTLDPNGVLNPGKVLG